MVCVLELELIMFLSNPAFVTSHWSFETSLGGNIYTMEISKWISKQIGAFRTFLEGQLLNIYQRITGWDISWSEGSPDTRKPTLLHLSFWQYHHKDNIFILKFIEHIKALSCSCFISDPQGPCEAARVTRKREKWGWEWESGNSVSPS